MILNFKVILKKLKVYLDKFFGVLRLFIDHFSQDGVDVALDRGHTIWRETPDKNKQKVFSKVSRFTIEKVRNKTWNLYFVWDN